MQIHLDLEPKDHAEAVAIFRAEIIGALTRRTLLRGELAAELTLLSQKRFRSPGRKITRHFSVPTLQRWYYAYRRGGLEALRPRRRSDNGHARDLSAEQRKLLLDIRREYPSASVPVILRTLVSDGRLAADAVSEHALRRLYAEHQLGRRRVGATVGGKTRLRWQAERPNALWHGDVCHAAPILVNGTRLPVRVHALLDDASRYVVALEARHTELELDMLGLLVNALRRHGRPGTLYLDNGPAYRGELLRVGCARLEISLVHAEPYDPQARGKMERFWGTLRRGCLDFIGSVNSLHDINVRLWAFLDEHYQKAPHASLLGRAPASVWDEAVPSRPVDPLDEVMLRDAMTVRVRRRIHGDCTASVSGQNFETDQGYLARALVTVAYCPLDRPLRPWIEHDGKCFPLEPVNPVANSQRTRPVPESPPDKPTPFDPAGALLDRASGRRPAHRRNKGEV